MSRGQGRLPGRDGCPDPDNDGDGIPDIIESVPMSRDLHNYQDANGCPDEVPAAVKKFTGVIEGINSRLARRHPAWLLCAPRPSSQVLQDYPDVKLEISGHTDNRGQGTTPRLFPAPSPMR